MTNTNNISLYARCNQQAEAEKTRKWEQIRHEQTLGVLECNDHQRVKEPGKQWWQDKTLWADLGPHVSSTEEGAIMGIFAECGGRVRDIVDGLVERVKAQDIAKPTYRHHQQLLRDILEGRGRTLIWAKINPTDTEKTWFEVPLEKAG